MTANPQCKVVRRYVNKVVAVHVGPTLRTHVVLADWLPVYMHETQEKTVPHKVQFFRCVPAIRLAHRPVHGSVQCQAPHGAKHGRRHSSAPIDTHVLTAAQVVLLREYFQLVPVTTCASENDVRAVLHAAALAAMPNDRQDPFAQDSSSTPCVGMQRAPQRIATNMWCGASSHPQPRHKPRIVLSPNGKQPARR